MPKKKQIIFITAVIFLLLVPFVNAVGIWSRTMGQTFDFYPNMQKTISYKMHSTVTVPMDYELYAKGDLSGYVEFIPRELKNISGGAFAEFYVVLKLPYKIEEPGIHRIAIGVREAGVAGSSGTGTGGRTAVEDVIKIRVLFPEPYLKASLDIPDGNANEFLTCTISLENWGEPPIDNIWAKINIYKNNEKISTIQTDKTSLQRGGYGKLTAILDTSNFEHGEYTGKAVIYWDGNKKEVEDSFKIGDLDVEVVSYTSEFKKGAISQFDIEVKSNWGNKIDNVYAVITTPNNKTLQTPSLTLQPWSSNVLTTYWNTENLATGKYNALIKLHYAGKTKTQPIKVWIVDEVKETERRPVRMLSTSTAILLLVIALVVFNIIWLYQKFKKK